MYHLVNTYENRVGLLKELYFKSTSKNKAQNRNVFYYKILVTRTSAFTFLWPLHSRASLGFPALLAELLRCLWRAQSSCHAYLGRVALFSIAVHSLYLLHVQHFSIRSCQPSATQKKLVRLFTKLKKFFTKSFSKKTTYQFVIKH